MLEGRKTIESRFSKKKILPWKNISLDDIVFIKKSGGKVVGYFKIKEIQFIDLELVSIEELKVRYSDYLCVDDTFWELKKDSKYATLIFIKEIVRLNPFCVNKKGMNTWVKLKED